MGCRCATRSYLKLVSRDRPWTGRPSTTQLIQGTMQAFLKITNEYAVSPDQRAFMVHGTSAHAKLEDSDDECSLLEQRFDSEDEDNTGISDVIETELGKSVLTDYKTSGSYKVAKALGFHVVDESTGEVYKSGKHKGEEKMRKVLKREPSAEDRWEWELQLNNYRIKAQRKRLIDKIDELKIQCMVRDGNTYIARSRGVFRNVYYFNIRILPDNEILSYFADKKKALEIALQQGFCKETCTAKENWDGLKCERFCEVSEFCRYGKYLRKQKEDEDMAIKGLSEIRRLPRLGKIRLGIKKIASSGKEHPSEVDYFILDPSTPSELENKKLIDEFHKLFGEKPKTIKIMFPVADANMYFSQFYKRYGSGASLKCKGDGESAVCIKDEFAKGLKKIGTDELGMPKVECKGKDCPYYVSKECSEVGILQVLLPDLPGAGVWQIATGSFHSIVNLNSSIDYVRAVCGRAHMIPLILERREQEIQYEGKKSKHYIMQINMDFSLSDLQKFALIDPTKALLELPDPEIEKEDILFLENKEVEGAQKKDVKTIEAEKKAEAAPPAVDAKATPDLEAKKDDGMFILKQQIEAIKKVQKLLNWSDEDLLFKLDTVCQIKLNTVVGIANLTRGQANHILSKIGKVS